MSVRQAIAAAVEEAGVDVEVTPVESWALTVGNRRLVVEQVRSRADVWQAVEFYRPAQVWLYARPVGSWESAGAIGRVIAEWLRAQA